MKKRILVITQLSNYDSKGTFILEADSGWQMCVGRIREMFKNNPDLDITITGPTTKLSVFESRQVKTLPEEVNPDLPWGDKLHYVGIELVPNALVTRYDFKWDVVAGALDLSQKKGKAPRWDIVYLNDPMHLRNFKALFHVEAGYQPKFYVHSHFVDVPSCPKFPTEASLWYGQLEAAIKADWNFWQCESALAEFEREARLVLAPNVVDEIMKKSSPWDDGYSQEEMHSRDRKNVRFDVMQLTRWENDYKVIIFVPNRIGGMGRSSDYTNCGKFMFEILPQLRKRRQDFVVIAGNPSQKFSNEELVQMCGEHGYVSLVPDTFNRDEFKTIAGYHDICVGLYDQDTYGGTAARECIESGGLPLWINLNEYSRIAREAGNYPYLIKPDWSDAVDVLDKMISDYQTRPERMIDWSLKLKDVVRKKCSYESTTPEAMLHMDILLFCTWRQHDI